MAYNPHHPIKDFPCLPQPDLTSPEAQGIPEGQILPNPTHYSHQGDTNTGSTLIKGPCFLPKGTFPLCLAPKPALTGEGQNPEKTEDLR